MANFLVQVSGRKLVHLFSSKQVSRLGFQPGSTTSDLSAAEFDKIPHATVVLEPGDVVYIPPLHPHAVQALEPSISVNVFWRDLDSTCYAQGRDIYGNTDLRGYEQARGQISRARQALQHLPSQERRFYLQRLADELSQ